MDRASTGERPAPNVDAVPGVPPLISIVLPVRDGARTLPAALRSLQDQTEPDWELLVVDDGSTDNSGSLAEEAARQDPRLRVFRQPARGLVAALNLGLAHARAPLVARMDADDFSLPDRLATQAAWLAEHPEAGLVGCHVEFDGDRQAQQGYALHVDWLNSLVTPEAVRLNRFVESPFAHPSVMFRRELLARHGVYRDGPFPEDYELWLRWLEAGVVMAKVPRVLLRWRDLPQRLSRTDSRYAPAAFYAVKADYLAREVRRTCRGRPVWVWGAGRPTRGRAAELEKHGVTIAGFIDIDPRKAGRRLQGRPVVLPAGMPGPAEALVLGYVAKRGARELIRGQLRARGFVEGRDSWMAA